ncbi:kinase-like protein [Corynespora cassiicola Philippines]|uniref:Kinase-like protein n=1 Tax=Corynespora cassiicola Philippines TaxID=1448308 RepID=A0A2T2P825_CORCC|nr:kinase-like protein [Corynespora cassiicola Philippines]
MHLNNAIITPALTSKPFLPLDALEELITADNVKAELTTRWYQKLFPVRPSEIVKNAKKTFTILTLIGVSDKIWELLAEGMSDEHLPLSRHSEDPFSNVLLSADRKKRFQSFQKWNDARVNDFVTKQWVVQAPVLDVAGKHYTLNEHCAIPIVNSEEIEGGQYSIVHRGEVHPAHQNGFMTENGNLRVAIKEFKRRDSTDFDREKGNLENIYNIRHQHLIRYHATYQWSNRYCVIFPWADGGNLSKFWKQNDQKEKTTQFTTWSLQQMHGLAAALEALHIKNCRHGDLKPDNILYFNQLEENLVIADVGISRFHKEVTMLRKEGTKTQATTPSYQGPEVFGAPDAPRPRRYDIWSLGCILLEFLVWYLHNLQTVEDFHESRATGESSFFYKHMADGSFKIHPKVVDKISALQADTRCQENAFGDLLALIKDHMLQIKVEQRHNADQVVAKLAQILEKSEVDPSYLPTVSEVSLSELADSQL